MFNFITKSLSVYILINLLFLVMFPIFVLYFWLPKVHVEVPVSGSIILAREILKLIDKRSH